MTNEKAEQDVGSRAGVDRRQIKGGMIRRYRLVRLEGANTKVEASELNAGVEVNLMDVEEGILIASVDAEVYRSMNTEELRDLAKGLQVIKERLGREEIVIMPDCFTLMVLEEIVDEQPLPSGTGEGSRGAG